jgi:hypothetical protein
MARDKVAPDEVLAMLREVADHIERGGLTSVTLKFMTTEGEEHTFRVETEEEQQLALLTIRKILGQVH